MIENLARWYSSESTQLELSNEYQLDRVSTFSKYLHPCALDESSLSIGRVKQNILEHDGRHDV